MAIQSQPSRISEPFAGSGTKNTIPATNATPSASQAASWASGFPPECSQPISAGGCPVPRDDVNGVLNQISQDFAFRQDGGIWGWSALADYATNRMVLGSDGLLYWSVAQSGPNVGGAQDPTTDTSQTYWSSMPIATPPLAEDSSKAATTEWVKDLAAAPVYLDPAGSDSNDGLSASTPVQTFARALAVAEAIPASGASGVLIKLAGGTYSENVVLDNIRCDLELSGNVTISGSFVVQNNSEVLLIGTANFSTTSSFSILYNSAFLAGTCKVYTGKTFTVRYSSVFYSKTLIQITSTNDTNGILVSDGSVFYTYNNLEVIANGLSGDALSVAQSSTVIVNGDVSMSGTSDSSCVAVRHASLVQINGSFTSSSSTTHSQAAIRCLYSSWFVCVGNVAVHATSSYCIYISRMSGIQSSGVISVSGGPSVIWIAHSSLGYFEGGVSIASNPSGSTNAFVLENASAAYIENSFSVTGSFSSRILTVRENSAFVLPTSVTVSGSPTGTRYFATTGGQINVSGAGANRIPGSAAGGVTGTSYAYYG